MKVHITKHARERMQEYGVSEGLLMDTINKADSVELGYNNRKIYQKKLNGHVLRVIVEEGKEINRVITVYQARSGIYGI